MRGSITRYELADGSTRWRIRWDLPSGPDGARRQRTRSGFQRRRDAERALAEVVHDQENRGAVRTRSDLTVAEYADQWLDSRHDLRPTTRDNYRVALDIHTLPRLGGIRLQDLTAGHLDRLYAQLLRHGKRSGACRTAGVTCPEHGCDPEEHEGLSVKSVTHVHAALHVMLEQATTRGLIPTNPAAVAHRPKRSPDGREHTAEVTEDQHWTASQAQAFREATAGDRLAALWSLLLATGLRRGEAVGLRWDDVDLDGGVLRIRRSVTDVAGQVVTTSGKSFDARRTLTLGAGSATSLREHQVRQAEERAAAAESWIESGHVFCRPDGRALKPNWVSHECTRWCERLGLPAIGTHGLRHTAATMMLRSGVPIHVVSQRLGHANVSITLDVYTHARPADDQLAAQAMDQVLFGLEPTGPDARS